MDLNILSIWLVLVSLFWRLKTCAGVSLVILLCAAFLCSHLSLQFAQMQDYADTDLF